MKKTMVRESDIIYIAGLFDGEGSVSYKQYMRKRKGQKKHYPTWQIRLELAMTDKEIIKWLAETLNCGTWGERKVLKGRTKSGGKFKTQWRWRCTFRDCYQVCRLLWPHVKVKLHKIEQVIDHYTPEYSIDGNVVSMQQYKEAMSLE